MGMIAENCIAFGLNEALKRSFSVDSSHHHHHDQQGGRPTRTRSNHDHYYSTTPATAPNFVQPFVFGTITGACSSFALLPSEVVKAKTQVATDIHRSSSSFI
jgi:hypothetical protein